MSDRFAVDTNIAIYAFIEDGRNARSRALLGARPRVSIQLFNEFANVTRRKLGKTWEEIGAALDIIESLVRSIRPLDLAIHRSAGELVTRYDLSFYDSLMVAAALFDDCRVLYSEDMQNGLIVDGRLQILNPYITEAA